MNSKYLTTQALILKRTNYKDADKILTIYTKDAGKLTALAKGIRKITSRRSSHVELFNHINIHLVEGKSWYIITQADALNSFSSLKQNLKTTQWGYYIAEIFEKLVPEGEKNEILFNLLLKTLVTLNQSPNPAIINAFNLKLIKILGYYSRSSVTNLPNAMREHLQFLEESTYKNVKEHTYQKGLTTGIHLFLKNYTEEILERSIKTNLML